MVRKATWYWPRCPSGNHRSRCVGSHGQVSYGMNAGNKSRHDARVLCRTARNPVGDLRRGNLGCLAVRSAPAACCPTGGVQSEENAPLKQGNKSDRMDAHKLAELLRGNYLKSVYHGKTGVRTLRELARSYLTITKDLTRVMSRLKALYRSWGIACAGREVYDQRHRQEVGKDAAC
jgi:hypothetical protein